LENVHGTRKERRKVLPTLWAVFEGNELIAVLENQAGALEMRKYGYRVVEYTPKVGLE
jgi:hypothetical protein